jgi:uroporphyrinogen III methyltransferase / synthase
VENKSNPSGIVYLVGAGPGHPGLITRLGYELLQQCDAVAYDALIPMELISGLPDGVEKYYVGKRAGRHSLPQSQISDLLLKLAKRGLKVVRLKGGDPFIFGRSGEEAEHLSAAGIPVVMIPGVTAASAAAAMSGFSLTNRQAASWIMLATGHGAESASIPVPWDKIAALPGGTFVIYMGLAKLDNLIAQILSSGLTPETPAMAIQAASTGNQKSIEAPLAELSRECERQDLKPPALIVIGEAIRYGTGVKTSGAMLAGKRILLTSSSQTGAALCKLLREKGAEPIPCPTVVRKPGCDPDSWVRFLKIIERGGLCFFAGEFDVDCFFETLLARGLDARSLNNTNIIACGRSTESALLRRGIQADLSVEPNDFTGLVHAIDKLDSNRWLRLIFVHGDFGDRHLSSILHELRNDLILLKISVESTAVWEPHWENDLVENSPEYIVFTSVSEVEGFFELLGDERARYLAGGSRIAAIDGFVADALRKRNLSVKVQARVCSFEALVSAISADSQI